MKKVAEKLDEILEFGGIKKNVILLIISGISLVLSLLNSHFELFELPFDIAWVSVVLCGLPIVLEALIALITEFDIKADLLVAIALIAALIVGEDFAAGEVAFIMQLGELLEELTVAKARSGIEKLVHLMPQEARVIRDNQEQIVKIEEVQIGDILRVLPGETIPVDGVIIKGETSINQAIMTGESLPVDKTVNDEVASGTLNLYGAFEMKASRVGEDSSVQKLVKLVQSSDASKAKVVGIADKWATWIVVVSLATAIITYIFTLDLIRAVTVLVVFCPCALVIATPAAIMAAIGNSAHHGFLIKEGDALERLSKVSKITFDKTGTLTHGDLAVTKIQSLSGLKEDELYALVASAEQYSEHPLGKAIVKSYGKEMYPATDFMMVAGKGVKATVKDYHLIIGNNKLLEEEGISTNSISEEGNTIIYVAIDHKLAGYLALADMVREDSEQTINRLHQLGVSTALLSGDAKEVADNIASKLGIEEVYAECLPEDKLKTIEGFQESGSKICMIGDGINDAPSLAKADVGIAMAGIGSDITIGAADIALIDDKVKELPHLFALSKRMMITIRINIIFSMVVNFLAIGLAVAGLLGPVVGALVHNAGSFLVICNSFLLLKWKKRKW